MIRLIASTLATIVALTSIGAAQAADKQAAFRDWRAQCAADRCVATTRNAPGDVLGIGFASLDAGMSMYARPAAAPREGGRIMVALDDQPGASLGAGDGWRFAPEIGDGAIEIAPSIANNEFLPRMRARQTLRLSYDDAQGRPQVATFSLIGVSASLDWIAAQR